MRRYLNFSEREFHAHKSDTDRASQGSRYIGGRDDDKHVIHQYVDSPLQKAIIIIVRPYLK